MPDTTNLMVPAGVFRSERPHHVGRPQRHLLEGGGTQIIGRRTDHPYAKTCECSTCADVREMAEKVRAKGLAFLAEPMAPKGALLQLRSGDLMEVAIAGSRGAGTIGTLKHVTTKAERQAARKAEKRARRGTA